MRDDYFNYYILSYFNTEKVVRLSQILHVLRGKRTPSMFYLIEINQWHHGFSINKRIERDGLKAILKTFLKNELIVKKDKGYLLTSKGKDVSNVYFEKKYYPKQINKFSNISLYQPYWERYQLFTQVFSEFSYANIQYYPIIKDPNHQENVRLLFRVAGANIKKIYQQWIREQEYLFENMEEEQMNVVANFLTGYNRIGKTRIQISKELEMQEMEFDFYFRDILEEMLEFIKKQSSKLPLLNQIINQTNKEFYFGLAQSTYQSYQLLKEGASITQIASRRSIKENTVKEHLLEMAFILDEFPVKKFVSQEKYKYLMRKFDTQKEYSFKKAVTENAELEFYQYRLVELERMRQHG